MSIAIEQLPETRRSILLVIKREGPRTASELAAELDLSSEGVRQHLMSLEKDGWIVRRSDRGSSSGGGRPSLRYSLTFEGEHLFPKHYDSLTVEVLDTVAEHLGPQALHGILAMMTEVRVREWEPRLRNLNLHEKVQALKTLYKEDDTYMEVEVSPNRLALVERNCPFMNVAKRRPVLCSVTISTLTRLLGVRVVREERFQNGDGRCVFRIYPESPTEVDATDIVVEE